MADKCISGNIGEHSELLALAQIILDGYLELGAADQVGQLTQGPRMEVFGVSRTPPLGAKLSASKQKISESEQLVSERIVFSSSGEEILSNNEPSGSSKRVCSRGELAEAAFGLRAQLVYWSSAKFKAEKAARKKAEKESGQEPKSKALQSEYSQRILDLLGLSGLRAKSGVKSDLYLTIDYSGRRVPQGFSVKSQMGSKSCLVNHSGATIFKYEILNAALADVSVIEDGYIYQKAVSKNKPESAVTAKRGPATIVPALFNAPGVSVVFHSVVNDTFKDSLEMIDARFPKALAMVVLQRFKTGKSKMSDLALDEGLQALLVADGMSTRLASNYLTEKLKDMLRKFALGMQAGSEWVDSAEVQGGWVLVIKDGKVVGYRFDSTDDFRTYLLNHTMIDTPSTSRVPKKDLNGRVGRVFEQDGKVFITLSLIVKFTE
jgi:hypothetical protein